MRGSSGAYNLGLIETEHAAEAVADILEGEGFAVTIRRDRNGAQKVEGIRGSKLIALLARQVPLLSLFGWGSRVRARAAIRVSLNDNDDQTRMSLLIEPMREVQNERESFFFTQSYGESLGDSLQCRRIFKSVRDRLHESGLIQPEDE